MIGYLRNGSVKLRCRDLGVTALGRLCNCPLSIQCIIGISREPLVICRNFINFASSESGQADKLMVSALSLYMSEAAVGHTKRKPLIRRGLASPPW